jgi:hypothetical protein
MVAGIAVGLDSSEDECSVVKMWSAGRKLVESDNEAAEVSNSNLKVCKPLDSDGEPGDDVGSDCRVVMEGTVLGSVNICKKKKWKILSDTDCSSDEETSNTQLTLTKGEDEVERSSQSHSRLGKESDLYDAEGSEDEVAAKHISKPRVTSLSERKSKVSLLHVEKTSSRYLVYPFAWSIRQQLSVRVK